MTLTPLFALSCGSHKTHAIDIRIHLDKNTSENPTWDHFGDKLKDTFDAAASIWEDLLPGPGIFDVDVEWDDDIGSMTLGLWTPQLPFINASIEINPIFSWFFDSTPLDNSEFDFTTKKNAPGSSGGLVYQGGQWFYSDVTSSEQSAWFTGAPPSEMEIGFLGFASSPTIQGQYDLLSVALHELGHELGVNSGEGPYEAQPAWIGNLSAGFNYAPGDDGHLAAATSLLYPGRSKGVRALPSALDVFAVADEQDFSAVGIDLDRKEYFARVGYADNWSDGLRWIGGTPPDDDDDAFIRSSTLDPTVELTAHASARNLFVGQGDDLSTNAHGLDVVDTLIIDGANTYVFADTGGLIDAVQINVQNSAVLFAYGGLVHAGRLEIAAGSALFGRAGTVEVDNALINNGTIAATGGDLTILNGPAKSPSWDLDGSNENGGLGASFGDLVLALQAPMTDEFNGTMSVGASHKLQCSQPIRIGSGAEVLLNGGTSIGNEASLVASLTFEDSTARMRVSGLAEIHSRYTMLQGGIELEPDASLEFAGRTAISGGFIDIPSSGATVRFQSDTQLSGGSFSGGGVAELNGAAELTGGTINVSGIVRQEGDATVSGPTTINGNGTWDLEGNGGDAVWNVNDDLTLNIARIDQASDHRFDGRINLNNNGTTMTVNTPTAWTMNGRLDLAEGTVLAGSAQMNVTRDVNAQSSRIDAPVAFKSGASVQVNVGAVLKLEGLTYYEGGVYRGGTIYQDGPANVTADTSLGKNSYIVPDSGGYIPSLPYVQWLEQFDWDGSGGGGQVTNIFPGVTFIINAVQIDGDPANDGYDGTVNITGGTLLVNTGTRVFSGGLPNATAPVVVVPAPWRLDGTMNLQEMEGHQAVVASQYASPLYIYGEVNAIGGNASIAGGVGLFPSGQIHVSGGASLSMGLSAGGTIDVDTGGVLHLNSSSSIESGAHLTIDGTAQLSSTTTFHGGTYEGTGTLDVAGTANFDETTRLDVFTQFESASTSTLAAGQELQLASDANIAAGAILQGDGVLHNLFGSTLTLADGGEIGVELDNHGTFVMGNSPGAVTVDIFTQGPSGVLEIELGGTAPNQFDQLQVSGEASLDGTLQISLLDGFLPGPNDTFNGILTASNVVGMFTNLPNVNQVLTDDGLGSFQLIFNPQSQSISLSNFELLSLPGDFDHDGDRDGRDFLIWQRGGSPHPFSAGDLADWQANHGVAGSPANSHTVPEPATLLLAVFVVVSVLRRENKLTG